MVRQTNAQHPASSIRNPGSVFAGFALIRCRVASKEEEELVRSQVANDGGSTDWTGAAIDCVLMCVCAWHRVISALMLSSNPNHLLSIVNHLCMLEVVIEELRWWGFFKVEKFGEMLNTQAG